MVLNSDLRLCLCTVSMLVTEPADILTPLLFLQCGIIPASNTNREIVLEWRFQHRFGTCAMTRHPACGQNGRKIFGSNDASFAAVAV